DAATPPGRRPSGGIPPAPARTTPTREGTRGEERDGGRGAGAAAAHIEAGQSGSAAVNRAPRWRHGAVTGAGRGRASTVEDEASRRCAAPPDDTNLAHPTVREHLEDPAVQRRKLRSAGADRDRRAARHPPPRPAGRQRTPPGSLRHLPDRADLTSARG